MKYLLIVGSEGMAAPEDVAIMRREIRGWVEEMDRRGVRLLGRPLDYHAIEVRSFQNG